MALRSVCLWGVLLLAPILWTLGVCQDGGATPKISVGFISRAPSGNEGEQAIANIKVEVPKDFHFDDVNATLTIVVTSVDGEAKAGQDFEQVDSTVTLTREELQEFRYNPDHQYGFVPIEISLTKDDYIEKIQTFTLTLEVESALEVEELIHSATFTIVDSDSDIKSVEISFEQTTYTAYASEGTPLKVKVLKTGRIRHSISVDVTFSNGQTAQTISFDHLQTVTEVSFIPESDTTISLALAEPSQNIVERVVFGAPAEVKVMNFIAEGSQIVMVLKGLLEEKYNELQGEYKKLEKKYEALQKTIGLAVWFDQNDYTVRESDRTVRVCLRKNLKTPEVISVTVTAKESSPASATGGVDFSTDPRKITIPAGSEETACTDIDIITDDSVALEGNETFTLTLTVDDHSPPITSAANVTIIDDDGVEVNLTDKVFVAQRNGYYQYAFDESYDSYGVDVCLSINTTIDGYLEVPLVLSRTDTEAIQNASVKLYAGKLLDCEQITIIPSEWPLKLEIGSALPDHVVAGSPSTATVDGLAVWFARNDYTVRESDKVRVCLRENVKTSKDLIVTVTAKESAGFTSAIGGKDFSTDPQTITIPAESMDMGHCKDLDIIIDDTAMERTETFTLTLTVEDHPGVTSSARVTIRDNDYNDYSTDYSTDYRDHYVTYDDRDKRTYVWVIVAVVAIVVIILAVAVAACVIYHQRTKIKDSFASPYKYKKLPTDIHIETITF